MCVAIQDVITCHVLRPDGVPSDIAMYARISNSSNRGFHDVLHESDAARGRHQSDHDPFTCLVHIPQHNRGGSRQNLPWSILACRNIREDDLQKITPGSRDYKWIVLLFYAPCCSCRLQGGLSSEHEGFPSQQPTELRLLCLLPLL